jgi:arsenate reductase
MQIQSPLCARIKRIFRIDTLSRMKVRIYEYAKCSTCRNALKFLDRRKVDYEKLPIVDTPPTKAELRKMLAAQGGNVKKLFNTSGEVYRAMKIGERLPSMSDTEALDLLASNGKLIKRPFVFAGDNGLVGFKEEDWKKVF